MTAFLLQPSSAAEGSYTISMHQLNPAEHITTLEPLNLSVDVSELYEIVN